MLPARLLCAVLGGLALLLAFPGYDAWFLAPVGIALLALATVGVRVRTGVLAGLLLGLCWYGPLFVWASTYAGLPPWIAMTLLSALYPAALGGVLAWLQRGGAVRPLVGACAWVVMEWGRSVSPFGGFPWGRLGFSQADAPTLGAVALLGVPGLGLVVALSGGLLARALQLALARTPEGPASTMPSRHRTGPVLAALGAALALTLAPLLVPRPTDGTPLRVAAVQGALPEGFTRTLRADPGTILTRYTDATQTLAADVHVGRAPRPDLVVWPESSSDRDPLNPSRGADTRAQIQAAVDAVDAPVLVGAGSRPDGPERPPTNSTFVFLPRQGLVDRYDKVYLAPFGEVMPLRSLLRHLSPWVDEMVDFRPGRAVGVPTVPLADGRSIHPGLGICFEVVVDRAMRQVVEHGADLIVVPTNNAWFGEGDESVQQLAASRVRAVEHGRSVVHISNVGESALITPDGVAHGTTRLFTQDLLQGQVPLRTERTPAETTGPWVEPLAALVLVGACALPRRRPVRLAG